MLIDLTEFTANIKVANSPEEVIKCLLPQVSKYGCEYMAFGPTNPVSAELMLNVNPNLPYITNYPKAWIERYEEKQFMEIDPVLLHCVTGMEAFCWKALKQDVNMTPKVRRFWQESEKHGLACGMTVPLHGPNGAGFAFSISSSNAASCVGCVNLQEVQALAYQFTMAYLAVSNSQRKLIENPLSEREKEILRWSSQGKSAWDISIILDLSEHTVNFHLKNAIKKLDTTNKVAAVVKAIRAGYIYL